MPLFKYEKQQNPTKHTIKTLLGTYSVGWTNGDDETEENIVDVEGQNKELKDEKNINQSSSEGETSKVKKEKEKEPFLKVDVKLGGANKVTEHPTKSNQTSEMIEKKEGEKAITKDNNEKRT
ncbi:uncharacterized protein FA14DRAFT_173264 [Meira miltonrushii]|uniref:Uncharacterized protein n=1 Tax=Meira miltonrushii TaxID=1280837 RepID=A0A316VDA5_9BASI|nr:uncharacterized protein FA14DRAFT_173264 [Meira miltonrushii]PWN33465.1 hypothetical protein FA14DRAFT_173264 [Meira miltonrushii]